MDDVDTALKAYKISRCDRCCIRVCKKDMIPNLNSKFIFKKWPQITVANLPDNIKWENLGFTSSNIFWRKAFIKIIALFILIIATFLLASIEYGTDKLKDTDTYKVYTDLQCQDGDGKSILNAYNSLYNSTEPVWMVNPSNSSEYQPVDSTPLPKRAKVSEKMICFCESYYQHHNLKESFNLNFRAFGGDSSFYCYRIMGFKILQYSLVFSVSLVTIIINEVAVFIFEKFVSIEKNQTQNGETYGLFKKIIILQVIDTAFVNFLVNWKLFTEESSF